MQKTLQSQTVRMFQTHQRSSGLPPTRTPRPPDDGGDVAVDPPLTDTCELLTITCTIEDAVVSSPVSLALPQNVAVCQLGGQATPETLMWSLRINGEDRLMDGPTRQTRTEVVAEFPGTAQLVVSTPACEVPGPTFVFLPPPTGWWFGLAWDVPDRRSAEVFVDMDLHVLQGADVCWLDRQRDLHYGSSNTLDWGTIGEPADNPHRGADTRVSPGVETSWTTQISTQETWELGAHARTATESEPVEGRLVIYRNGEELAAFQQTFTSPGYWRIASVNEQGVVPIQLVSETIPACTPPVPIECDGRVAAPETCNGIDDDCDGDVDESPEACAEHETPRICQFFPQTPDYAYRCIEL